MQLPQKLLYFSTVITLLILPAPLIGLEIGEHSRQLYGREIPDIWIYGAFITGKDLSFGGINFAYKFQRAIILFFAFITFINARSGTSDKRFSKGLIGVSLFLLTLFPIWLWLYIYGVICNSDNVSDDLTLRYGIGLLLYLVLFSLTIQTLKSLRTPAARQS